VGDVFNIGSTSEVTIGDLAIRVKKMTNSDSAIQTIPYDVAYEAGFEDMPRRVPDISKIHSLIGFAPKIGLDDIIRTVIEHVRQREKTMERPVY
jgi:UDP-glucose 4-epimerase